MTKTSRITPVVLIAGLCSVALASAAPVVNGVDATGGKARPERDATGDSSLSVSPTPGAIVLACVGGLLFCRRKALVGTV